jgi:hypothetical protein
MTTEVLGKNGEKRRGGVKGCGFRAAGQRLKMVRVQKEEGGRRRIEE